VGRLGCGLVACSRGTDGLSLTVRLIVRFRRSLLWGGHRLNNVISRL
jgi:hypothetical protein